MPFAESEPSDRFINFVSFATGVLAFECAFNSFTSAAVYSLRTFFFAFLDDNGEDNEDGDPAEPSLGSVGDMHLDQERWAYGNGRDLEQDDGESGIADQDGLDEQVPFRDWQGVGMV